MRWWIAVLCLMTAACVKVPPTQRPAMNFPPAFKEAPPAGWKNAQPSDGVIRGKWWEMYKDPALNALEEQVNVSNQNVLAAEAQYRSAKASVKIARSALFPTATVSPSYTRSQASNRAGNANFTPAGQINNYEMLFSASYEVDVWGAVRKQVSATAAQAQAAAANVENVRLLYQTDLAIDYFQLHGFDGQIDLLQRTVKSFQEYLTLTKNRYEGGVASEADVAQAETQLYSAQASLQDVGVARAQMEHAVAILAGKAPAQVTIPPMVLTAPPPVVPLTVPSVLLERRPDIAMMERQVAAANEEIGVARAAFYPTLTLAATGGSQAGRFLNFMTWPSRFWAVGPQLSQILFDAGKRRGQVEEAQAQYDVTAANYRETVLTAFQEVEDQLAALRILEAETVTQTEAVRGAEKALRVSTDQYSGGIITYLQVLTDQSILYQNQTTLVNLLTRRLMASVQLIQALGGGWDLSKLPDVK